MLPTTLRRYMNIYLTVFIANLPFLSIGHVAGWSSPSIPIITSPDFYLKISEDQASWITSIMPLGGFFGPLVSGPLLDIVGRKWTITVNMAVALVGWIVMSCTWSVEMMYIGRFISGVSVAVTFTTVPIYIAEISEANMRGVFNNLGLISRCHTTLFQYIVGPFVSYHTLILLSCVVIVLYFILIDWLPESPYFLVAKGRKEEAEKTLSWLRGGELPQNMLNEEISEIQAYIDKSTSEKGSFKDLFNNKNRKIVITTLVLLLMSQLCGATVVMFFLQPIFEASGSTLSPTLSANLVGIAMASVSFIVPGVVTKTGYKKPMVLSSAGLGICLAILGGCFTFKDRGVHFPGLDYIPVMSLLSYIIILSLGMLNQPWALAGEILPSSIKSQASAIATSICFLLGFVSSYTFPLMMKTIGTDFSFWTYSFFMYVFVPETKGLTLNEIQEVIKSPQNIKGLNLGQSVDCTVVNGYSKNQKIKEDVYGNCVTKSYKLYIIIN